MSTERARPGVQGWAVRLVAAAGVLVVGWACLTAWGAVVHGHPAYAVLLALTATVALVAGWRSLRPGARPAPRGAWRRATTTVLLVVAVVWIAVVAWLRPFVAVPPAPEAMRSGGDVSVSESATQIVLTPAAGVPTGRTAVFFQPGARVDPRAYAAVLRPLAEAGHTVVVAKQPLGIGFLAVGAFDDARADHPQPERWVVAGHSLGGTVAARQADEADDDAVAPAVGLLLYASYPGSDIGGSLDVAVESVSGTRDGLSRPEKIEASRADLPDGAVFTVVQGASHAQFGDYGPQPGDGVPTVSDDDARAEIAEASVRFVTALDAADR